MLATPNNYSFFGVNLNVVNRIAVLQKNQMSRTKLLAYTMIVAAKVLLVYFLYSLALQQQLTLANFFLSFELGLYIAFTAMGVLILARQL